MGRGQRGLTAADRSSLRVPAAADLCGMADCHVELVFRVRGATGRRRRRLRIRGYGGTTLGFDRKDALGSPSVFCGLLTIAKWAIACGELGGGQERRPLDAADCHGNGVCL